ncbi:hypothetical protein EMCRGX_G032420 [Ephydatia muelleri]|eukprot:Em0019g278a
MDDASLVKLLEKLRLVGRDERSKEKVLDDVSLEGIVKHIQSLQASNDGRKVLVMTGAGISTAAGIPDFRSPGTGLYDNLQKYNLPSPQSVFEIQYFRRNPKPFFHLARELYPAQFKPTLSHYFIRLLAEKNQLLRSYTQNIDTLERRAGINEDLLVEAHGAFHNAHCIDCGKEYSHEFVRDLIFKGEIPMCTVPGCAAVPSGSDEMYHGLVKPDIVFFGESLPERFATLAPQDAQQCQLLVILGTSLVVQPFASLVGRVPDDCPRLLINLQKVGCVSDPILKLLGLDSGLDFDSETNYRDVFLQDTCDNGCKKLAQMLGWEEELMELVTKEHCRLETIMQEQSLKDTSLTKEEAAKS